MLLGQGLYSISKQQAHSFVKRLARWQLPYCHDRCRQVLVTSVTYCHDLRRQVLVSLPSDRRLEINVKDTNTILSVKHNVTIDFSPSSLTYDDTHNTLKYANRAKNIKANVSPHTFDFVSPAWLLRFLQNNIRITCLLTVTLPPGKYNLVSMGILCCGGPCLWTLNSMCC